MFLLCFVRRYQSALQLSATRDSLKVSAPPVASGVLSERALIIQRQPRDETTSTTASHSGYAHPERSESRRLTLGQMPVTLHPWYCVRSQERRIRKPPSWIIHHTSIVLRGPAVRQQSESEADLPLSRKVGLAIKLRPGCLSD